MTLNSPLKTLQLGLESITTCEYRSTPNLNRDVTGPKSIDSGTEARDGDYWEHYVAIEAWRRGAEVYMNLGRSGKTDLVIEHEGRIIKCDVKARSAVAKGYPHRYYQPATTKMDTHKPIFMVCVHPVTKQIHWHESRVPTGWEGFWDEATY